jgi:exodeoxyribonuclease VII large subunit
LWSFNEEVVIRAASQSLIPLIPRSGETDVTLLILSLTGGPTPTAAAEMAVPVRPS